MSEPSGAEAKGDRQQHGNGRDRPDARQHPDECAYETADEGKTNIAE